MKGVLAIKISDERFVESFKVVAPYLRGTLDVDMMVCITDREKFIYYLPGEKVDVRVREGDTIPPGELLLEVMKTGKQMIGEVPEHVYGVPFKAMMTPIVDRSGNVIGCLGIGLSTEKWTIVKKEMISLSSTLSESLHQLSASSEEMAATSEHLHQSEKDLHKFINQTATRIQEINKTLKFINKIASQTKMLGINAAIEAARVGDRGRGFAIVAEEIRQLSEESMNTSKQINDLTEEINVMLEQALQSVEKSTNNTQEQAAVSEEITASIQDISGLSSRLADLTKSTV
ncbi:hypothetical protein F9B85_08625 [Heliorestis acidaminivorans]|uniref:Methyl-accepting transducer domain-containing protein n=1 Tax=Heliorestis acidaminivorans TaxID=553427 RepID=A0A6I0ESE4_9FIRM|nr:methyl-accepting chemotaxis protein [Heliorestis acidaminivorans]KAB2952705.1 hypothetical protein F9B85_08625 [Heliorestis acidaminivorans]